VIEGAQTAPLSAAYLAAWHAFPRLLNAHLTIGTKQEHIATQAAQEEAVGRLDREKWRQEISAKFPHHVDVVPPPMGYSRSEEEEIMNFLESRIGTFDLFGAIADGTPFIRYCFEHAADAEAFRARFNPVEETATLREAG
jgi:hypothetical protein